MYKFVNPFKYLSRKQSVMFVSMAVISTASFLAMAVMNNLYVRVAFGVAYLISSMIGMMSILYVQARITRKEFEQG